MLICSKLSNPLANTVFTLTSEFESISTRSRDRRKEMSNELKSTKLFLPIPIRFNFEQLEMEKTLEG